MLQQLEHFYFKLLNEMLEIPSVYTLLPAYDEPFR